jgi:hypothetical protein
LFWRDLANHDKLQSECAESAVLTATIIKNDIFTDTGCRIGSYKFTDVSEGRTALIALRDSQTRNRTAETPLDFAFVFHPENEDSMLLRNVRELLPDYTELHPRIICVPIMFL